MAAVTSAVVVAGSAAYSAYSNRKAAKEAAKAQEEQARAAIDNQNSAAERAIQGYDQYQPLVERGIAESDFLANPQAQYDYLQSNPLYSAALSAANEQSAIRGAASGKLYSGATDSEYARNVLLSAIPLIDRQREDINNLLNLGTGITSARSNAITGNAAAVTPLITSIGESQAAGTIGAANATSEGIANVAKIAAQFYGGGAFSNG